MPPAVDDLLAQARKAATATRTAQDAARATAEAVAADRARRAATLTANTPEPPAPAQAG